MQPKMAFKQHLITVTNHVPIEVSGAKVFHVEVSINRDVFWHLFSWQCNIGSCETSVITLDIASTQLNTTTVSRKLNIWYDEDAIFQS